MNYDAIPCGGLHLPGSRLGRQDRGGAEGRRRRLQDRQVPLHRQRRAKTIAATEGFVKVLADAKTDRVLGVHMIGAEVGEMIGEAAWPWSSARRREDIARTCHPHPTLSEAVRQAAMGVEGWTMQM